MSRAHNMTTDPDGYCLDDIIARLHNCIDNGRPGLDYSFLCRAENDSLFENYVISDSERISILRQLTIVDYEGWEYSNSSDYLKDIIHFFHKPVSLFPRGIEDGQEETVNLYIKVTWTKPQGVLIIISFHE